MQLHVVALAVVVHVPLTGQQNAEPASNADAGVALPVDDLAQESAAEIDAAARPPAMERAPVVSNAGDVGAIAAEPSATLDNDKSPRTYAWPGVSVGPRFGEGGVGLGTISVSYRLVDWLEPEFLIGGGPHASLPDAKDLQVVDRFSIGARFVAPLDELRPFLWLALHHEHQAQWDAVLANPVGTIFGVSNDGVAHYTGIEGGIGTALRFPVDGNPMQAMVRVNVAYLPALGGHAGHEEMKDQLALLVDIAGGLPLSF